MAVVTATSGQSRGGGSGIKFNQRKSTWILKSAVTPAVLAASRVPHRTILLNSSIRAATEQIFGCGALSFPPESRLAFPVDLRWRFRLESNRLSFTTVDDAVTRSNFSPFVAENRKSLISNGRCWLRLPTAQIFRGEDKQLANSNTPCPMLLSSFWSEFKPHTAIVHYLCIHR